MIASNVFSCDSVERLHPGQLTTVTSPSSVFLLPSSFFLHPSSFFLLHYRACVHACAWVCVHVVLSCCHVALLSCCHAVLLSCCPVVPLSYCPVVLLSCCHVVLVSYCPIYIDIYIYREREREIDAHPLPFWLKRTIPIDHSRPSWSSPLDLQLVLLFAHHRWFLYYNSHTKT